MWLTITINDDIEQDLHFFVQESNDFEPIQPRSNATTDVPIMLLEFQLRGPPQLHLIFFWSNAEVYEVNVEYC
jgi:hypothetical protein